MDTFYQLKLASSRQKYHQTYVNHISEILGYIGAIFGKY